MSVLAVSAAGILMGLWFKVPALIAATALLLMGSLAWNVSGMPGHVTVVDFLILAFAMACAYLFGLSMSARVKRNGK